MVLTTHPAVVNILNLGPGDLHILTLVLGDRLAALGGDGILLSAAVWCVVENGTSKQGETKLGVSSGQSLAGSDQQEETEMAVHSVECCPGKFLP